MSGNLLFENREAFAQWLIENGDESNGVWLLFGKKGGPKTLTAMEALEEALCFGWIDGQMQSIDETQYIKYFARRTPRSRWSDKNKKIDESLIVQGRMARQGFDAIDNAKKNGAWDAPARARIEDEQIEAFKRLVSGHEPAYANLLSMSPSVQRTYTGFYLDAKSETARAARLEKIIDRLNKNLKPM